MPEPKGATRSFGGFDFLNQPGDPLFADEQQRTTHIGDSIDFLKGSAKGLLDIALAIPTLGARIAHIAGPADLRESGLNLLGGGDPYAAEGKVADFLRQLPAKAPGGPFAPVVSPVKFGKSVLEIFGLPQAQEQIAGQLETRGAPTELSFPLAIAEVTGPLGIVRGLFKRDPITGEAISTEDAARELVTGIVPAEVIGAMAAAPLRKLGITRGTSLVDKPAGRVVTKSDLTRARAAEAARMSEQVEAQLRYDKAARILDDEPAGDIPIEQAKLGQTDYARVIANDPASQVPPDIAERVLKAQPEMVEILEPAALRQAILGSHEDVLAALRQLPEDARALPINQQIAELMRTHPGLPQAKIVEIAEKTGMSPQAVTDTLMASQWKIADDIEKGATKAGGYLHELSDPAKAVGAMQALSPNQADRLRAMEQRLRKKSSAGDIISDIAIRPMLANMVSGWGNAWRDFLSQQGFNLMQSFEHVVAGMGAVVTETAEGATRKIKGLQNRPKDLDVAAWSDGWHELHQLVNYTQDLPSRMKRALSPENLAYQKDVLIADWKGATRPPRPDNLRTPLDWAWTDLIDEVPTLTQRMLSNQLADINAESFRLDHMKLAGKKIKELGLEGNRAQAAIDLARVTGDAWASIVTMPRRLADIEQSKQFFQIGLVPRAARHGIDMTKEAGINEFTKLLKSPPETRPPWVDKAIEESMEYSLTTTFRADPKTTLGRKLVDTWQRVPLLNLTGVKFMKYLMNKNGAIMDRRPWLALSLFKPEFIRSIGGLVDETKLVNDVIEITPKAKKLKDRALRITEDAEKRSGLLEQARQIASSREDFPKLRDKAIGKIQERALRDFSRGLTGIAMLSTALQIRNSPFAGPKYYQMDFGPVDPNNPGGERRIADTRNYPFLPEMMGLATVLKSVHEGRDPFQDIGGKDITEIVTGVRRLEESVLGFGDVVRALDQGRANPDGAFDAIRQITASNVSAYSAFFRNLRDVTDLADMGDEQIAQDIRNTNPWSGPFLSNLPNFMQSKLRDLQSAGRQTGPLPPAINPYSRKPLYAAKTGLRLLGVNIRNETGLQRLLNRTGLTQGDLVGRSGNNQFDQLVAKRMGWLLGQPAPDGSEGQTMNDFLSEAIVSGNQVKVQAGMSPIMSLRETTQEAIGGIRKAAQDLAMIDAAMFDANILRDLELKKLSPAQREWAQRVLKIRPGEKGKPIQLTAEELLQMGSNSAGTGQ